MGTVLRLLFVYRSDEDVDAVASVLRDGGYEPVWSRVDTRSALRRALAGGEWDAVISDFQLDRAGGLAALALLKESGRDVPFFLVSDALGEETAVAVIKAGAADYIPRDNVRRLVFAMSRELREAETRRARRCVDLELQRREEQLRMALDAARMGTWEWDVGSDAWTWSDGAAAILGLESEEMPTTRAEYLARIPPAERSAVERGIRDACAGGTDYRAVHRIMVGTGRWRWLDTRGRVYGERDASGAPARMAGTVADITDRKRAEAATETSAERYRELYEDAPVALFSTDAEDRISRANRRAAELFGCALEDLVGTSVDRLYADTPASNRTATALLRAVHEGQAIHDQELELVGPRGDRWWGSLTVLPMVDDDGTAGSSRWMLVDITVRKQAEELLQLSQRAIDGSVDQIGVCDTQFVFRRVNQAYVKFHDRPQDEIVGRHVGDVFGWEAFEQVLRPRLEASLRGADISFEAWFDTAGAGRRFLSVTASPLLAKSGDVEGIIIIARDVTERLKVEEQRLQLESQVRQTQKMEALGTLAGGIAHDFNNLLLAILGYSELTRDDLPEDSPLRANIEQILAAGERAQSLVKQILAFGRRADQNLERLDARTAVHEVLSLFRTTLPSNVAVQEEFDDESCAILADSAGIHQIVLNLAANAAHAMRGTGGTLTVGVRRKTVSKRVAQDLGGGVPAGSYVVISMRDTGHGIPADVRDRIFDPFFTTKEPGEGRGLGLSVVHGIVSSHGGTIWVDSIPGVGTHVEVYLRAAQSAPPTIADEGARVGSRGTERILLVDDEEQLAHLAHELLARLGYQVTTMTSSEQALSVFEAHPDAYDLVVTDQTMPRCTGLELTRAIRQIRRSVPVVLTTGYSEAVTPESVTTEGINAVVMKPYKSDDLARAIRKALTRETTVSR